MTQDCEPATSTPADRKFWLNLGGACLLLCLTGTGVLLKFVLERGSFWMGLGRHDWAEIHFWLSVALVGVIVTHLVWHASWIAACWRRNFGRARSIWTVALVAAATALIALPLVVPAQAGPGAGRGQGFKGPRAGSADGPARRGVFHGRHRLARD